MISSEIIKELDNLELSEKLLLVDNIWDFIAKNTMIMKKSNYMIGKRYMKPLEFNIKEQIRLIIFEADTPAGKLFDITLIVCVILNVLAVMLESVASIGDKYGNILRITDWFFTVIFTIEYFLRLYSAKNIRNYAFSFFGIIDLLAIIPTYASLLIPGSHYFLIIRILRVMRIFRVLKLASFISETEQLVIALRNSGRRILVFLLSVLSLVSLLGSIMYIVESSQSGFTSIPRSIYWAIVTLTTVGYGDISPTTELGQFIASAIMILGYSLIVVPTGFVSVSMTSSNSQNSDTAKVITCKKCEKGEHDNSALFCKFCGEKF